MYDDRSRMIAKLLLDNFNVRIRRLLMFETNPRNTPFIPALYFGLNEDENTEKHYQIINDAVESFTGKIKWCFGKAHPSRINYEIIPCVARDLQQKRLKEENQNKKKQYELSESEFNLLLENAIEDIPDLCAHMEVYFKSHL